MRDSKSRPSLGRAEVLVWSPTKLKKQKPRCGCNHSLKLMHGYSHCPTALLLFFFFNLYANVQVNYNAPLSRIVKLQNKAIRVINDVPLMESITPHYTSLGLLKFPDIVKLNTCMLFYDYFHHEKFPNIPVSLVSELHNYSTRCASSNQVAIPSFRTNQRRFCSSITGSFFWNDILQFIRDKPSKKMFRKALSRWYLA